MPIGWVLKIDIHRFIERFKNFRDFISDIARSAEFPPGVLRSLDYLSQWQLARSNLCDGLIVTRSLVVSDMVFASPNFFIFVVRRYSGVSWLEVCRKLAAGRELSRGRVQVASEYRLGGEALFARSEALFVASPCERAARNARLAGCLSPWDCRFVKEVAAPQSVAWSPRRPAAIHVCMSWGVAECSTAVEAIPQVELAEGSYRSSEEALLAGLKALRESRDARRQLTERLASFQSGRAIVLDGDEALGEFLDTIDAEVDAELQAQSRPNA
jgi:hypothetical protein